MVLLAQGLYLINFSYTLEALVGEEKNNSHGRDPTHGGSYYELQLKGEDASIGKCIMDQK